MQPGYEKKNPVFRVRESEPVDVRLNGAEFSKTNKARGQIPGLRDALSYLEVNGL